MLQAAILCGPRVPFAIPWQPISPSLEGVEPKFKKYLDSLTRAQSRKANTRPLIQFPVAMRQVGIRRRRT
jgi:hypothetical protein